MRSRIRHPGVVFILALALVSLCLGACNEDTIPPSVSDVALATTTSAGEATITWTTEEPATSQVEYGRTTSYGSISTLDENLVTSHSVTLSGLLTNTTYSYRVRSEDASGNEAISDAGAFASFSLPARGFSTTTCVLSNT
ncbi:MAG: fibronectin type III domain-containing protein, partial [Chloroflexi bacterium]|nr:fibronectin type III domain-containing protein [Chloroflexota bacterium]